MLSHNCGVTLKAFDNLIAIAGLTPALPFIIADRVLRVTLSALAASVTVKPNGSR